MSTTTPPTGTSPTADPTRPLGELVTAIPGSARVFERHGLDYCCGGSTPLDEAAAEAGADVDTVIAELVALEPLPVPDWAGMGPAELVDHIESTHHAYLHSEMPRLGMLADKVAQVHGPNHPELLDVARAYEVIRADLSAHLLKEERMLFPAVREMAEATSMPWFPFGRTSGPISVLLADHDVAGRQLVIMRELTNDFELPPDACASYTALYQGLEEFERDLHLHVHKENNVLFGMVAKLEESLVGG